MKFSNLYCSNEFHVGFTQNWFITPLGIWFTLPQSPLLTVITPALGQK